MTEQLSFTEPISEERRAFELIYPQLSDLFLYAPIEQEVLVFQDLADCSSVYFLNANVLFFQIRLRKKARYLLLPAFSIDFLPEGVEIKQLKSDSGMIRIPLNSSEEILNFTPVLRSTLAKIIKKYHLFGCCGRYEQCSDAKECIHPDVKFALGCQYRQNLMDGRIFYGKNRNIK